LRNVEKLYADSVIGKFIHHFAGQRQKIFIWKLDEQSKFVADINAIFPFGETSADADLANQRFHRFAVSRVTNCRNIQRKSDVPSLFDSHLRNVRCGSVMRFVVKPLNYSTDFSAVNAINYLNRENIRLFVTDVFSFN
jgi:hypothetical protein